MRELWKVRPSLSWPGLRVSAPLIGVALAAVATSLAIAPDAGGVLAAALAMIVITIAVIDARHFIIPDELNVVAFALGLAHAGLADDPATEAIALAALRGAALAFVFLIVRATYQWLRGRQGIGLGDVKLAAVAGAWLDWQMMPIAINIAALMALVIYTIRQIALGRSIRTTDRLPFGLFLAPAIWVSFILDRWLMAAPLP
jgi:leader peptidase (prepilin peptidase) / N-methyltransferase